MLNGYFFERVDDLKLIERPCQIVASIDIARPIRLIIESICVFYFEVEPADIETERYS